MVFVMSFLKTNAQISSYQFSQSNQNYVEISGGTLLGNESTNEERFVSPAALLGSASVNTGDGFPIGFDFIFNGQSYDRFSVMANGWISLGKSNLTPSVDLSSSSHTFPLASNTALNENLLARIAGFGFNIAAQTGATLRFETIGVAPNRTLVIQWKNYRRVNTTGDNFNFQIRLNETSNVVDIVYGINTITQSANSNIQVGLRAAPLTSIINYLTRKSANSWTNTTPGFVGTTGTEYINLNDLNLPPNGLTYHFTPPTCSAPAGFQVANITNSGVTLNWEAISPTPTNYEYSLSTTNATPTNSGATTTSVINVINNLTSNTIYYVYLRTNCGSGFSNWSYVGSFRTLCDSVTDFAQNFDNFPTGTGNLPDCWSRLGTSTNGYIATGSGFPGTAPNNLYLNISASNNVFVILPFVSNLQANTHRLRFKASATATGKSLKVGYFTTPGDTNTFVEVGATPNLPNAFNFNVAQEYTIVPNNIPAGVNQLVFTLTPGSATTVYVDDVSWELNSTCTNPSNLSTSSITNNTAVLSWTSGNETAWEVQYGAVNFSIGTGTIVTGINTNPYTLTNLIPNTTYEYYVRAICNSNNPSAWIGPLKFKTTCNTSSNFFTDFGALTTFSGSSTPMPDCWDKGGDTSRTNISTLSPITVAPFNNKLAMSSLGSTTLTPTVTYALMPPVNNLQATTHRLRFRGYTSSNTIPGVLQLGYLTDAYDVATFTYITDFSLPVGSANETEFKYNLPFALPSNAVRLAFKFEGITTASTQIFILLDNVYWEAIPTCEEPSLLNNNNVLSNTATLSWIAPTSLPTNGYEYYVSTDFTNPNASTTATGTVAPGNTSVLVSGLLPSTTYYAWVRSVCSGSDKSYWTAYTTFKTLCAPVATLSENFDNYPIGTANPLPLCWDKLGTINNVYITSGSVFPASAQNRLYLYASNTTSNVAQSYAALPLVSNLQDGTHRIRFKAYNTSGTNRYVQFGYLTDSMNPNSFELLEEFLLPEGASNATEFFYSPGSLPANAARLAFRNISIPTAVTTVYLDDVFWELIPSCQEVSLVQIGTYTITTAELFWTAPNVEPINGYQYYVSNVNVPPTSGTTPTGSVASGTTNTMITGLNSGTQYFVWVRSICANENSLWSGPASFVTECPPVSEFIQNFDGVTTPNLPNCWTKILRGGQNLSPFATITTSNNNVSSFPNFTMPNAVQLAAQFSAPGAEIILVSPNLSNISAGTHRLKFHSYYPGTVVIGTLDSNNPMTSTFTPFQTVTLNGNGSLTVVNFNTYTGVDRYIGIKIVPDQVLAPSIVLDNIIWEPIPACSDVTAITILPASTTAQVSWTAGSTSETSWQVAVGATTVTDPNTLTALPTTTPSIELTGLTPNTPYKVWVRSLCGTNIGNWNEALFTTACAPQNVPFEENFNSAVTPNLPSCTTRLLIGGGNEWQTQNYTQNGFSSIVLRNPTPPGTPMNAWFFTNGVNLLANTNYEISYKRGTNNGFTFHNLKSAFGINPTIAAMTTILANHVSFAGAAVTDVITFTVPANGVYYFGFHGYDGTSGTLYLDDIKVDVSLSTSENFGSGFKYYPNPVNDVLNISHTKNVQSIEIFNLVGQSILSKKVNSTEFQVNISNFPNGTYLVKVNSDEQTETFKVVKN